MQKKHCYSCVIRLFKRKKVYGDWNSDYYYNNVHTVKNAKASECLKCGLCEQICPQHLHIRDLLEEVAQTFEKE